LYRRQTFATNSKLGIIDDVNARVEKIGYSKNGHKVTFDPQGSHAATHFADNPGLRKIVEEALPSLVLEGLWLSFDTDMGRIIGLTDGVTTDASDEIVYAKRKGRDYYTPFTKSRPSQPSSLLATVFHRQVDGSYELVSAWIGSAISPPFPGEPTETPESRPYWSGHALVWGTQAIEPGSETPICPWKPV
jgi:hypothetical protein